MTKKQREEGLEEKKGEKLKHGGVYTRAFGLMTILNPYVKLTVQYFFSRMFQKATLEFIVCWQLINRIYNYSYNVHIVLGITSNLGMI